MRRARRRKCMRGFLRRISGRMGWWCWGRIGLRCLLLRGGLERFCLRLIWMMSLDRVKCSFRRGRLSLRDYWLKLIWSRWWIRMELEQMQQYTSISKQSKTENTARKSVKSSNPHSSVSPLSKHTNKSNSTSTNHSSEPKWNETWPKLLKENAPTPKYSVKKFEKWKIFLPKHLVKSSKWKKH